MGAGSSAFMVLFWIVPVSIDVSCVVARKPISSVGVVETRAVFDATAHCRPTESCVAVWLAAFARRELVVVRWFVGVDIHPIFS